MTRPEFSGVRDLKMSGWIRQNLPDSSFGFYVTDLDFILYNWQTKKIMLLEVKTRNGEIKKWQKTIFIQLERWIRKGIDDGWAFLGFSTIKFENTFFDDGRVFLNGTLATEEQIKKYLSSI